MTTSFTNVLKTLRCTTSAQVTVEATMLGLVVAGLAMELLIGWGFVKRDIVGYVALFRALLGALGGGECGRSSGGVRKRTKGGFEERASVNFGPIDPPSGLRASPQRPPRPTS